MVKLLKRQLATNNCVYFGALPIIYPVICHHPSWFHKNGPKDWENLWIVAGAESGSWISPIATPRRKQIVSWNTFRSTENGFHYSIKSVRLCAIKKTERIRSINLWPLFTVSLHTLTATRMPFIHHLPRGSKLWTLLERCNVLFGNNFVRFIDYRSTHLSRAWLKTRINLSVCLGRSFDKIRVLVRPKGDEMS